MRLVAIAGAVALPCALFATRFQVVATETGVWRGASDLPGPATLGAAVAIGLLVAWAVRRWPQRAAAPLLALAAAALPLLPVLSGRHPLLLLFQGPVLILVAAAAAAVALVRAFAGRPGWRRPAREPLLFGAGFGFYLALAFFLPGPAGPQGDEPHYLLITQSLLGDRDVDLQNQLRERQYAPYFGGTLEPHTSPASPAGRVYSIHTPGLSALLAPAFAGFGYPGARGFVSLLAALTGVLVHRLVRDVSGSPALALAAWALLTFSPPLPFYALAIYPEVPGALATAVWLLSSRRDPGPGMLAAATACAAGLIWVHPRYLPLAALGLTLTLVRRCRPLARVLAGSAFLASLALLLLFFERHYGAPALSAAYGAGFASDVSLARAPRGALGLFFDRQFGLLPVAPAWVVAVPGALALLARRTGDGLRALLLGGASLGAGASFSMWWGGSCPPARFTVAALPALALCAAAALPRRRSLAAGLFGIGLGVVLVAAGAPRALHNRADGESGLLRVLAPALDLDPSLPAFATGDANALPLAATLAGAAALAWSLGGRGLLLGALGWALVASGLRGERPLIDGRAATLELLERWDETNLHGLGPRLAPERLRLALALPRAPWSFEADQLRNSRPLDLPAGLYELRIDARVTEAYPTARVVKLDVVAGDLLLERRYLREDEPLEPIPLVLPAGARRLVLTGAGIQGRALLRDATLVPLALVPRRERDGFPWPRRPQEDLYRVEDGDVRATALDLVRRGEAGFELDRAGRFVVEAPPSSVVRIALVRPNPRRDDVLFWGERRVPLGSAPQLALELSADDGLRLGPLRLVPVRIEAPGSLVAFGAAEPR